MTPRFPVISSTSYFAHRTKELEDLPKDNGFCIENTPGIDAGHPALPTLSISSDRRFTSEA